MTLSFVKLALLVRQANAVAKTKIIEIPESISQYQVPGGHRQIDRKSYSNKNYNHNFLPGVQMISLKAGRM